MMIKIMVALALALAGARAYAQDYPTRPVKIVSDSGAGSAVDVTTRMVADRLGQLWRQQVVVANHPGAGGAISAQVAAQSAPDGYTLYVPALSVFLSVPGKAANLPLRLPRDFAPIGSIADQPMFIAVSPALGVNSLPELIARAKQRPGELAYAATGVGRLTHLTGELLQYRAGIKLQLIPYSGGPSQAVSDVMGGRIPIIIEAYAGMAAAIQSGVVKPIATGATRRLPDFPNVMPVSEMLPGFEAVGWTAVLAPVGTPQAIINKVNVDLRKVLDDPELKKQLALRGSYARPMSPTEVATFVNNQQEMWKPILEGLAEKQK